MMEWEEITTSSLAVLSSYKGGGLVPELVALRCGSERWRRAPCPEGPESRGRVACHGFSPAPEADYRAVGWLNFHPVC